MNRMRNGNYGKKDDRPREKGFGRRSENGDNRCIRKRRRDGSCVRRSQ